MADLQINQTSIIASSATTAPAQLAFETWSVTALPAAIPTLLAGQTLALTDATSGASTSQQAEVIRVTAANAGATSITVQRGCDGTTPVAHTNPATFNITLVAMSIPVSGNLSIAFNNTGTATTCSGGTLVYTFIASTGITVPICPYPVMLEWDGHLTMSGTAQPGSLFLAVQETTTGTATLVGSSARSCLATNSGADSKIIGGCPGHFYLGPTTAVRTFSLYGVALWDSTAGAFTVANSLTNPTMLRAFVL